MLDKSTLRMLSFYCTVAIRSLLSGFTILELLRADVAAALILCWIAVHGPSILAKNSGRLSAVGLSSLLGSVGLDAS